MTTEKSKNTNQSRCSDEAMRRAYVLGSLWQHFIAVMQGEGERAKAQRAALFAFAIRLMSAAIAYLSQVILARWMGSFEYGIFVLVWVWVLIIGGLAPLGLSTSVIRFLPHYQEQGQIELVRGFLYGSRWLTLGLSTAIALLGALSLYLFGSHIEGYYLIPAVIMLFCLPLYAMMDLQDGMAKACGWMALGLMPTYILRPLLLLVFMLIAHALPFKMDAITASASALAATWAALVIQFIGLQKRFQKVIVAGSKSFAFSSWIKTSLPIFLMVGFDTLLQNTDVLMLSYFASPSDVAIYFAALKTIALIVFVRFAISAALGNRFAAYHSRGDKEKLQQAISDALHWTFWPSLALTLLILLAGYPLLSLFGSDFTAGYPAMFILAVGFLMRSATGPAEVILNMLGEQKISATILFATFVLNMILTISLIPHYSLLGAASATAMTSVIASILFFLAVKWRLGIDLKVWKIKSVKIISVMASR